MAQGLAGKQRLRILTTRQLFQIIFFLPKQTLHWWSCLLLNIFIFFSVIVSQVHLHWRVLQTSLAILNFLPNFPYSKSHTNAKIDGWDHYLLKMSTGQENLIYKKKSVQEISVLTQYVTYKTTIHWFCVSYNSNIHIKQSSFRTITMCKKGGKQKLPKMHKLETIYQWLIM